MALDLKGGKMHKGVHLKTVTLSNGAVAFHAYCDDDPARKVAVHTCYVEKQFGTFKSVDEVDAEFAAHLKRVEDLHAARLTAEAVKARYDAKQQAPPSNT